MLQIAFSSYSWLLTASHQKDGMLFPVALSFLVAILGISLWHVWTIRKPKKDIAPLPPGPHGLPIVGYLPYLGTDNLHLVFTDLAAAYGPIYKLWLGNKLCVVISSAPLAKEVVRDNDITFSERDPPVCAKIITFGLNDIVFDSYSSPDWRMKRKVLVREMLSHSSIKACYVLRREQVLKGVQNVAQSAGKPIDFGETAFLTSINAMMSMLWGGKQGGEQKGANVWGQFRDLITEIMVILGKPNVSDIFPVLARFDIQGLEKEMTKIVNSFDKLFNSMIEERENFSNKLSKEDGNTEAKDFLQLLLDLKQKNDSGISITMNQVKALLMDIVVGGTDTTSTMMEWTMAELIANPEAMKKVKQEIDDVAGSDAAVDETHLPKLRYLDAAVKEAFRLHPPLPLLVPRCPCDLSNVGGYSVPKGTRVFLNIWCIQRDPQLWENPLEFKPERFLTDHEKLDYLGNDSRYMPFGSGRRMCAGVSLGEKMLYSSLAAMIHAYDWKLADGEENDLIGLFGIIMKKKKPLILVPTPRPSNLQHYMK
ncbi:hypothetical protein ES319_D03G182800v1 [Gossypium barbadense]|uniref:Cytochrome P450 n=1 Tax=Gossypium barbadense TaxID=3634 RepID=A0A5J5SAJ4_GOSBA|nr:hypothetical protein ES319_D03G182800v1 [Gossypium barbadense]